ncbi:CLUMA_CG006433, isoform A [Clunio marinus]|uniref:CLUMA_CG006433, isoform A n=1 Tax=Clunio marinus TaxID=568069 RepID=A0A1J1I1X2_9DIPT|nr:CLUMA_CG006433, isoform A [Clunio marinus]
MLLVAYHDQQTKDNIFKVDSPLTFPHDLLIKPPNQIDGHNIDRKDFPKGQIMVVLLPPDLNGASKSTILNMIYDHLKA